MHPCLRAFIRQYVAVVVGALVPVVLTTFVSVPINLGTFLGDHQTVSVTAERHLT